MDVLSVALQLAFFAVFAAAIWRYYKRPGPIELAVVAIFGATAAIFAVSLLSNVAPGISEALSPLAITLLLAQPFLVLRLVNLVRPLARWVLPVAFAGFAVAAAGIIIPPERQVAALLFVAGYFVVVEGAAAVLLVREGLRRYGVPRLRLALAGTATALFGISIFVGAIGAAAAGGGQSDASVLIFSRATALTAGLGFLAAFVPPGWLRNVGQRAVAFDMAAGLVATPRGSEGDVLWRSLAREAREILGARQVRVKDAAGNTLATTDQPPVVEGDRPPVTVIEIPASASHERVSLEAEIDGRPLFLEDDLAALSLLGSMTMRAVEREQAILRLAEARRELEEAAVVRASEARFRALLEAHPNAVLAINGEGEITWATGLTGELFGRPAESLRGVRLGELMELDGYRPRDAGEREPAIAHLEAQARRADGGTFPADVSVSSFELDGNRFELAVVSDASWRHEANLLRDRFLGVLSHELRTPITAIYGGTQILLKRGQRLDEDTRHDLLAGVTAEAERLQRIVENLLVLARVERGADFFDARPVLLKPTLTDLIDHERQLWPELTINLSIERGLPLVAADEEYLSLIVRNLLSNVAKYAGQQATVDIVVLQQDLEVLIRVLDDGPGIREEEADQLFGLYFRSREVKSAAGAGIGLYVCRGLVTAMHGRVWARTRDEGGAEFGFSLPVYEEPVVPEPSTVGTKVRAPIHTETA